MSNKLVKLEPVKVFSYFEQICGIPHGSGNCKALSDFCVNFATERNLQYTQDEMGNVIIRKPASKGRESDPVVMLQGHLDMVCEKTPTSHFDFHEDSLRLGIDGDYIYSKNTTLGGDDGIAVAMSLAILDDERLSHPPLEVLFTVDEEVGMLGAQAVDLSECQASYLINIDAETDNVLWAGCAGGLTARCTLPLTIESFRGMTAEIVVSGLRGGHSGSEIDREHANGNIVMGRVLHALSDVCLFSIVEINGGRADNVITNECRATVSFDMSAQYFIDENNVNKKPPQEYKDGKIKELSAKINKVYRDLHNEYKRSDPGIIVSMNVRAEKSCKCVDILDTQKIIFFLMSCPQGIKHMSRKMKGLVETSANLGKVEMEEAQIQFLMSVRSSVASRKYALAEQIQFLVEFLGGDCEVIGDYPGWDIKKSSKLRKHMSKLYKEMYGIKPDVQAIHAGLECGYILEKMPNLDIVSIGPNILGIHSVEERLSISSTKKMYKYIVKVLATIK